MRVQELLTENFADGKNPQDKGDSARHGIPKKATAAELKSAASAKGRKGQLARWQMNMRGIKENESVAEDAHNEIHNYEKLDGILIQLCDMVEQGQHSKSNYGMVAAAVLDPDNRVVARLNYPNLNGQRVHAERAAMQAYSKKYGNIPVGSIIVTTCSPCNEYDTPMADARHGSSCADHIDQAGIGKVYCGYQDPSQQDDNRKFSLMVTADLDIRQQCQEFASTFVDQAHLTEDNNPRMVSLEKKYNAAKDALGLARERRKNKGQHQQGPREITLAARLSEIYSQIDQLKRSSVSESICSQDQAHGIFDDFEHSVAARGLAEDYYDCVTDEQIIHETAAWRRSAGKSKSGGLNAKGVASYRKENPGSKLQTAVTTPPSKLKPGSKAAKRRKSFCARMGGNKGPMKKPNGDPTRKALALRKWNC